MSILRLAFSFFVISALWFRWIPRSLEYFRRNYMTSGLADALLDKLEELEPVVTEFARTRSDIKSLPEDLRQRLLKLPELIRSCLALVKDAETWPQLMEAVKASEEAVGELNNLRDAVAQHLLDSGLNYVPPDSNTLPRTDPAECK